MSAGTVIRGGALSTLRACVDKTEARAHGPDGLTDEPPALNGREVMHLARAARQVRGIRKGEQLVGLTRLEAAAALTAALRVPQAERSGQLERAIAVLEIASEAE